MNERKNTSYILLLAAFMLSFLTIYEVKKANGANKDKKIETKTQLKKVSKVKTTKTLPKKKASKKPTQQKISSKELSKFIQKKLAVFEGIQFQIYGECPNSFAERDIHEDRNINKICHSHRMELGTGLDISTKQTFFNGMIVEYSKHMDGLEPISLDFHDPEELSKIKLWIDGAVVIEIVFKDNLVSSIYMNSDEVLRFKNEIKYIEKERLKPRLKTLSAEKKKVEKIMNDLCIKTGHSGTCKAHKELRGFEYPLPSKLLSSIIQP